MHSLHRCQLVRAPPALLAAQSAAAPALLGPCAHVPAGPPPLLLYSRLQHGTGQQKQQRQQLRDLLMQRLTWSQSFELGCQGAGCLQVHLLLRWRHQSLLLLLRQVIQLCRLQDCRS